MLGSSLPSPAELATDLSDDALPGCNTLILATQAVFIVALDCLFARHILGLLMLSSKLTVHQIHFLPYGCQNPHNRVNSGFNVAVRVVCISTTAGCPLFVF